MIRTSHDGTGKPSAKEFLVISQYDVNFNTNAYEFAHGKQPRGDGHWGFSAYASTTIFWAQGSYTEAKRAARKHFAALDIDDVVVCS